MKNNILYIVLLFTLFSCQEFLESGTTRMGEGDINVVARIPHFSDVEVTSRGTKSGKESKVTNMYMFILDNSNNVVYRQYEASDKPLFTINRSELTSYTLTEAKILIVANLDDAARTYLRTAANLDEINNCDFAVSNSEETCIDIPELGFPMIGTYPVDLHDPDVVHGEPDVLKGTVLEIPLDCIYAKVVMNISVDPLQSVAGVDQSFQLKSWKVYNVPSKVRLGQPADNAETEWAAPGDGKVISWTNSEARTKTNKPNNIIYESSQETDSLFFEFYVPEHKINPNNPAAYPWDPKDDDKYLDYRQYLKPTLVQDKTEPIHPCEKDQKAIYVEINGTYKDHNNTERDVTYTIYLGDNNYNNFHLLRNHQYNNSIIIKGIKNSTAVGNENWVTYDHRVNVTQEDFSFGLQRETLLDCHWEIRPIRIDFNQAANSDAVVEIVVPNDVNWLSIESPSVTTISGNAGKYCDVGNTSTAYGKRRYYTTNLNTELNGTKTITIHRNNKNDHTVATLNDAEAHTVWAYIDEFVNTNDGAPRYRYATVKCKYYASEAKYAAGTPDVVEDYIFRQNNVFKIEQNGNTYFIEYYEEYLYNYDTKDQYGGTTDGMVWGLDGEQISNNDPAVAFGGAQWEQGSAQVIQNHGSTAINNAIERIRTEYGARYDFYLTRDINSIANSGSLIAHDHGGLGFTKDIYETIVNQNQEYDITKITTKDTPTNAVVYCLNRNKRIDNNGNIDLNNIKWYMPAIDEIEEICMGGYGEFEVFQDKYYWSSQPAYQKRNAEFSGQYKNDKGTKAGSVSVSGTYFADDKNRARATKVNNNFQTVLSGSDFSWGTLSFEHSATFTGNGANMKLDESSEKTVVTSTDSDTTGKTEEELYQPGNQPRTNINRVRCVYKAN